MVRLRFNASWFAFSAGLVLIQLERPSYAQYTPPAASSSATIVKEFDFNERPLGNLEPIPMLWEKHQDVGFPEFSDGAFDDQRGNDKAPSFHLSLNGRSVGYHYTGLDIPIEPNSEYRIVASIKPENLVHARAYLSTFFRDANGHRLDRTEQRSIMVSGNEDEKGWHTVSVHMSGGLDTAFYLGISVWVVQRDIWESGELPERHIDRRDVFGGAWFDDIQVFRLPKVELGCTAQLRANLYEWNQDPVLTVRLGNPGERDMSAALTVYNAAEELVTREQLKLDSSGYGDLRRIPLKDLSPGLYHALLDVQIDEATNIQRRLRFAKLVAPVQTLPGYGDHFGILLDASSGDSWPADETLLSYLQVKNLKLLFSDNLPQKSPEEIEAMEAFIKNQVDAAVSLTGTFVESSKRSFVGSVGGDSSLIDLFCESAETWRPFLASILTRFESSFSNWQVGHDGSSEIFKDARLGAVLQSIRTEMSRMTTLPLLAAPWSAVYQAPEPKLPADFLSITVPHQIPPHQIPSYINAFDSAGYGQIWLLVESVPPDVYRRLPRLADFAKRLIMAQHNVADRIYIRQPWDSRVDAVGKLTEPREEYLVYRTIVRFLDGARYMGKLSLHEDVTCHAFDRHGKAILVAWSDRAPVTGTEYDLHLSGADKVADVWGAVQELSTQDGNSRVRLSPLPVFIHVAETWLVQFRQQLRFDPFLLPSESTSHERSVVIHNPRKEPISGMIRLKPPRGWQIMPPQVSFALQPGETARPAIRIQSAPREPAGLKQIHALVYIDATRLYEFGVWLPMKLDLSDIDVAADFVLRPDRLLVTHHVTNRSDAPVTFRSFVDAPGYKRRTLNIINLLPGSAASKVHIFPNPETLSGAEIRVGLKEIRGAHRVHDLILTVP